MSMVLEMLRAEGVAEGEARGKVFQTKPDRFFAGSLTDFGPENAFSWASADYCDIMERSFFRRLEEPFDLFAGESSPLMPDINLFP